MLSLYKGTKYWNPFLEITDYFNGKYKDKKVFEIGPGKVPLKCATTYYDIQSPYSISDNIMTKQMDINRMKYDISDKFYDFGYSRHVFEDIQNPDFALKK